MSITEKIPPHDLDAEMSLVGALVVESRHIDDALEEVPGSASFYFAKYGAVYDAVAALWREEGHAPDSVQIMSKLDGCPHFADAAEIKSLLLNCASRVPDASNARYYARIVRDRALLRGVIGVASTAIQQSYQGAPVADVLDELASKVGELATTRQTREPELIGGDLQAAYERAASKDGAASGLATGFYDLDGILSGLHGGQMIVLAGRPSMGKSLLASNIAEHVAQTGGRTLLFSLEMSREELANRIACSIAGVDMMRMKSRMLRADELDAMKEAVDRVANMPLLVDDRSNLTINDVRAVVRRQHQQGKLDLVVVDYLQLMRSDSRSSRESRQVEVSEISRGIKALAMETKVPVIALSQLNRAVESRDGNRPRVSDLRESGSLEQDADVVLLLHREAQYHAGDPAWLQANSDKENTAEVIIGKQRNGPTGIVALYFDGPRQRFRNFQGA